MSNIQTFLEEILSARYGKDVRQSIHDAIVEIDGVADTAQTSATAQAEDARKSAQTSELSAKAAATSEVNAKTYMESAQASEINAKTSETNAKASENSAKESENIAKLTEECAREVFESIPEDYSTISNDLYELAIKETASGEEIHVNDSSNLKLREFALYGKAKQNTTSGKQLIPYPYSETTHTDNGITFTDNGDGSVTVNGTATSTAYFNCTGVNEVDFGNENFTSNSVQSGEYICTLKNGIKDGLFLSYNSVNKITSIDVRKGTKVDNVTVYPMIRLASITDDTWEPYTNGASPNPQYPQPIEVSGASGSVEVKSCGKNLLKNTATTQTVSGVVFTLNEDKSVSVSGKNTSSGETTFRICTNFKLKKGKYICTDKNGTANAKLQLYTQDWKFSLNTHQKNYFELENDLDGLYARISVLGGATVDTTLYPMIRRCDENGNPIGDDIYEPYKETLSTIPTPNGLAGIKVSSGGNYTDQNGQQWLSDKKVKYADGSGEDVRRFETVVFDGSDDEEWQDRTNDYTNKKDGQTRFSIRFDKQYDASREICAMSNIGYRGQILGASSFSKEGLALYTQVNVNTSPTCYITLKNADVTDLTTFKSWLSNNNISVCYELAEPITTPLTAEEIAEIEKLHTFYPITNISNDADCGMSVTYYADSKNYIDKKISELATAMVNNI